MSEYQLASGLIPSEMINDSKIDGLFIFLTGCTKTFISAWAPGDMYFQSGYLVLVEIL